MRAIVISILCIVIAGQPIDAKSTQTDDKALAMEASRLDREAVALYGQRRFREAIAKFGDALAAYEKLYPSNKFPEGHADIVQTLSNLGLLHHESGRSAEALAFFERALAMRRRLYSSERFPQGHLELMTGNNQVGFILRNLGRYDEALPFAEAALADAKRLYPISEYPSGHPNLLIALSNLGVVHSSLGSYTQSIAFHEQTLEMAKKLFPASKYPDGHPQLTRSLTNLGSTLRDNGDFDRALSLMEQSHAMSRRLFPVAKFPKGHPELILSASNLGGVYNSLGEYSRAIQYLEEALAVTRQLYPPEEFPNGHPNVIHSLFNVGGTLRSIGRYDAAQAYYELALSLATAFFSKDRFPSGHPMIAMIHHNLGGLADLRDDWSKSKEHTLVAYNMYRELYPPSRYPVPPWEMTQCRFVLGYVHFCLGEIDAAREHLMATLELRRRMYPPETYPHGHPRLAQNLATVGHFLEATGQIRDAMPYFEQAQAMQRRLADQVFRTASEQQSLAYHNTLPLTRDAYLTALTRLDGSDTKAYDSVWRFKSAVTRVLEQRRVAARAAEAKQSESLKRLRDLHRQIETTLQNRQRTPAEGDRMLTALDDERSQLERQLAKSLPWLAAREADAKRGPSDLLKVIPARTAFVDFASYFHFDYQRNAKGHFFERKELRYTAFVLGPGQSLRRIELGACEPIDSAIRRWRTEIDNRADGGVPEVLAQMWGRIRSQLPHDVKAMYLSPDGDLARLPWAALPGSRPGTILLEDLALAVVPHGPFLLSRLEISEPFKLPDRFLIVGGVQYDPSTQSLGRPYPALPGSAREQRELIALAGPRGIGLSGADATSQRIQAELQKVQWAHIATHGLFDEARLTAERKRQLEFWKNWRYRGGRDDSQVGSGARSPLAFTGLVFAGVNGDPTQVLTGESLVALPLESLRLVVLSACQTGLGEWTAGEGVFGLTRAFHLAGCPNVVSSLWNINDAASAALMNKFYHELWVNHRTPIEALREAQLLVYRHPELIADLAGERGAPKLKEAIAFKAATTSKPPDSANTTGMKPVRSPTKLWAAFILSGVNNSAGW